MRELAETHMDEPAGAEAAFDWYQSATVSARCRGAHRLLRLRLQNRSETFGNFRPPRLRATVHPCLGPPCLALPCAVRRVFHRAESLCCR